MARRNGTMVAAAMLVVFGATEAWAQLQPTSPPETVQAGTLTTTAPPDPNAAVYGAALRARWISVPGWFLGFFLKAKVPLSSYAIGGEFFRRSAKNFDLSLGLNYQKMGPPDGNWLGKGEAAGVETDFLQFRNFGLVGFDASVINYTPINEQFRFHYGAGLGLAIVTGKLLRVSAAGCTEQNVNDTRQCRPSYCPAEGCTEAQHKAREGRPDAGPGEPHRFAEDDVPGALPILNMLIGVDWRIPQARGLEVRLDAGFYNAFFVGLATGYVF